MFSTPRNYKYLTVAVKEADTQLGSVLWALQMCTLPIHYGVYYLHIFFLDSNWEVPVISWDAEQRSCFCIDSSSESYFSKLVALASLDNAALPSGLHSELDFWQLFQAEFGQSGFAKQPSELDIWQVFQSEHGQYRSAKRPS